MRHVIYICLVCFLLAVKSSSQGFNHTYDGGFEAAIFTNIDITNDTITLIGSCLRPLQPYRWGICFIQMDTFGNIFRKEAHYTDEGFWSPIYKQGFVKLKDHNGYAIVGTHFNTQRGYLLRLDEQGNLIYLKRYPKGNFFTNYWHHILEVPGGFLVTLNKQKLDYDNNSYLYRLNNAGNILWQVSLGDNKADYVTGLTKINDNEYVVAQAAALTTSNYAENKGCTQLYGLDSLGTLKWFWASPLAFDELGAVGLHQLDYGDWIYASFQPAYDTVNQSWHLQPEFIRRDSNFNLIWTKPYGTPSWDDGGFQDMKPYPGGGYVATGFLSDEGYESGFICRVDDDCNPIWQRLDTAFVEDEYATNKLVASGFLSSGSIIACGQSVNWAEEKSYAWLLKITSDGCIDTLLCNPIVSVPPAPVPEPISVQVFPNPAHERVYFRSTAFSGGRLEIMDLQGRIVKTLEVAEGQSEWSAVVTGWPGGMYFYKLTGRKGGSAIGKIVIDSSLR